MGVSRERRPRWWSVTGLGFALLAGGAFAEARPPQPAVLSLQQNELARATQSSEQSAEVFSGPARELCQLSDTPPALFIFQPPIVDDDAKVLSEADRLAAWNGQLGRPVKPSELCEMRDRLAQRIFRRGVLARVIIPPQTIKGGVVRFRVIASKIVAVRFLPSQADIGPVEALAKAYLSHIRLRETFDLDVAQRWLLLVNDIPGIRAQATIVRSTRPGAPPEGLDLIVTLSRVERNEIARIANTNSTILGPWSGIARVDFNSLTALGERTSLIAYTTLGNNRQQVAQIIESARLGDSGLFAQASFAYGHSAPGDVLGALQLDGDSYSSTFEIDYPLMRLPRRSLILAAGMDFENQSTNFSGGQRLADDALRVAWVRSEARFAWVDPPFLRYRISRQADLTVQARKGLEILGASAPGSRSLSRFGGRADAWVVRADGHALLRIEPPIGAKAPKMTLKGRFVAQWADRPLLAYEEQAIGNSTIGRGYDPAAVSGDRVLAGEVRFEVGPLTVGKPSQKAIRVAPYVLYDAARVTNLDLQSQNVTLRSLGAGLEFSMAYDRRGDNVVLDLGYARPLDRAFATETSRPLSRWLMQLTVSH